MHRSVSSATEPRARELEPLYSQQQRSRAAQPAAPATPAPSALGLVFEGAQDSALGTPSKHKPPSASPQTRFRLRVLLAGMAVLAIIVVCIAAAGGNVDKRSHAPAQREMSSSHGRAAAAGLWLKPVECAVAAPNAFPPREATVYPEPSLSVRAHPHAAQLNYRIAVHTRHDIVSDALAHSGVWEAEDVLRAIRETLQRACLHRQSKAAMTLQEKGSGVVSCAGLGEVFIDVGANIGYFTTYVAALGHKVIAIEPFQRNVDLLMRTVCRSAPRAAAQLRGRGLNGAVRRAQPLEMDVTLFKVALLDKPGADMCLFPTNGEINVGNGVLKRWREGVHDWKDWKGIKCEERIRTTTMDGLFFSPTGDALLPNQALLMKMDIEGSETRALMGATRFLHTTPPCVILLEHQPAAVKYSGIADVTAIFSILVAANYSIWDGTERLHAFRGRAGNLRAVHGTCWWVLS